jgi:hypothetical protein
MQFGPLSSSSSSSPPTQKTAIYTATTSHTTQFLVILWILFLMVGTTITLPPVIRIGAIFTEEQKDSSDELAFKYAVYKINKDKSILPKTTLVYDIQYVPKDDSFRTSKKGERLSWSTRPENFYKKGCRLGHFAKWVSLVSRVLCIFENIPNFRNGC